MWISNIQKAIDFVEAHLLEEIDFEKVANEACSSVFHFQRTFSVLCGFTLGDYIRMRRLSLAANDLINSEEKIIDIALKYGYETPESFSRAFTRFHEITPSQARLGKSAKSFSRLSVKLSLVGGTSMEYRIEKLDAFKVVCKRTQVNKPEDTSPQEIVKFWDECNKNGTTQKIISYFPENPRIKGLLGICFTRELDGNKFPYGIGIEYDGRKIDEDLEVVEIPSQTFAVFSCCGKMPDVFQKTYKKIVTEFFPQNDRYEYNSSIELEVYPSADLDNPNYKCEIWIAVNEIK